MKRQSIKADFDADAVKALIKAGAIPLAVTNVSELCMWMESYNKVLSSGYNLNFDHCLEAIVIMY